LSLIKLDEQKGKKVKKRHANGRNKPSLQILKSLGKGCGTGRRRNETKTARKSTVEKQESAPDGRDALLKGLNAD